jgi:hypothetical protein
VPIINDEGVVHAIHATIARQILEGLGTEHRDAILQEAITRALKDWKTIHEVEKVVAVRAAEVAAQLCRTEDWTARIEAAIQEGFTEYLENLKKASEKMLVALYHGTNRDSFSRAPGTILAQWPQSV